MNETLSSSLWPNFSTSRPNLNDQFAIGTMNAWQQNLSTTDIYSPDDYNNVWSAKSNTYDENEKESIIKSIWSTNASPSNSCTETNSHVSDGQKNVDETPTNSPSLKRIEIINCNDRWGCVKINQITPWSVIEIDESEQRPHDPMVWRAKIDGTEVWEDYYMKQHGRRLPQSDSSFNCDNVWSSASEISQSTNSVWPANNKNDMNVPASDIFSSNLFSDINNRPSFNAPNGVRPSMTRNQAQKYLIDMGYSLSDAIGALVNNQMDLPKAINELQSKYRMSANGPTVPNGMYTPPTLSFNNRPGDNVNMTRIAPGTPINPMVGQNNPMMAPQNFANNFDMFHQDPNDQILESSQYMNMDPTMSPYGRMTDPKRQGSMTMNRDTSFRNTFPNNVLNSRTMSNNCGPPPFTADMNALSQGINRMNLSFNPGHPSLGQNSSFNNNNTNNNKWSTNSNGFNNGMHNSNTANNNTNNNMILNTNNGGMDMRQSFGAAGLPSAFGRSISKQQIYQRNPSAMGWHGDGSAMSPNGALNDISQVRLAKNMSCTGLPENIVGIIVRKVPSQHIEIIKSICYDSVAMTNFQLQPHTQSILVHFNSPFEARRCMSIIQNQINVRVELINEDYMHCMPGANCQ